MSKIAALQAIFEGGAAKKNSNTNNNNNTRSGRKGSFGGGNSGRRRSGTLSNTCELVSNNMDTDKTITVKFFYPWDKFFTSEAFSDVGKGFKISEINNNAYGNEFKDTGVEAGWQLVKIGKRKVGNKNYTIIRGDLEKNSKFGGFVATFLDVTGDADTQKDKTSPKQQTQTSTSSPTSSTVASTNNNRNNSKAKQAIVSQTPQVRSSKLAKKEQYAPSWATFSSSVSLLDFFGVSTVEYLAWLFDWSFVCICV